MSITQERIAAIAVKQRAKCKQINQFKLLTSIQKSDSPKIHNKAKKFPKFERTFGVLQIFQNLSPET